MKFRRSQRTAARIRLVQDSTEHRRSTDSGNAQTIHIAEKNCKHDHTVYSANGYTDDGAPRTFISYSSYKELQGAGFAGDFCEYEEDKPVFVGPGNEALPVIGCVTAELCLPCSNNTDWLYDWNLLVLQDDLPDDIDVLVGRDILRKHFPRPPYAKRKKSSVFGTIKNLVRQLLSSERSGSGGLVDSSRAAGQARTESRKVFSIFAKTSTAASTEKIAERRKQQLKQREEQEKEMRRVENEAAASDSSQSNNTPPPPPPYPGRNG